MSDYEPVGIHKKTNDLAPRALKRLKEIFALFDASYTKQESNERYERIGTAFTKTESNDRFSLKSDVYTKPESDVLFDLKADRTDIKDFRVFGNSPLDFGAKADGNSDDAPFIAKAINEGKSNITLLDASYRINSPIVITRADAVVMGLGHRVFINNEIVAFQVLANNVVFNSVRTEGGKIVFNYGPIDVALSGRTQGVTGGKVLNCMGYSPKEYIRINYGRNIEVANNRATDVREFGCTVWGGDANPGNTHFPGVARYYAGDITITGNTFRGRGMDASNGTTAGIWGCCMERVTVTGNNVAEFTDVGIDFEGSRNCVATGNTAINCGNAGYAVFFITNNCNFTGNTYERVGATTFLGHAFLFANTGGSYEDITVANNSFLNGGIILADSNPDKRDKFIHIVGNSLNGGTIALTRVDYAVVNGNTVHNGHIALHGGYMNRISDNQVLASNPNEPPIKHIWAYIGHSNENRAGVGAVISNNVAINAGLSNGASIVLDTVNGIGKRSFIANNVCSVEPAIFNDTTSHQSGSIIRGIF